uniref:Uncharacterized protein n=1 Tax=Leersia perrieri TaxID=77586 RepID=A0A0D9V137_9ORYZ
MGPAAWGSGGRAHHRAACAPTAKRFSGRRVPPGGMAVGPAVCVAARRQFPAITGARHICLLPSYRLAPRWASTNTHRSYMQFVSDFDQLTSDRVHQERTRDQLRYNDDTNGYAMYLQWYRSVVRWRCFPPQDDTDSRQEPTIEMTTAAAPRAAFNEMVEFVDTFSRDSEELVTSLESQPPRSYTAGPQPPPYTSLFAHPRLHVPVGFGESGRLLRPPLGGEGQFVPRWSMGVQPTAPFVDARDYSFPVPTSADVASDSSMAAASPTTPGRHFVQSLFSPDYPEAQNYLGDAPSLTQPTQPTEPPVPTATPPGGRVPTARLLGGKCLPSHPQALPSGTPCTCLSSSPGPSSSRCGNGNGAISKFRTSVE